MDPMVMLGFNSSSLDGQQSGSWNIVDPLTLVGINVHIPIEGGTNIGQLSLVAGPGIAWQL